MHSLKTFAKPYPSHSSSSEIQAFISELGNFKQIEQLPSIHESLAVLEKSFSGELRLRHPRDIYPIYEALTFITNEVAKKSLNDLSHSWKKVLEALNKRNVYRIGLGSTFFDTSTAQEILTTKIDALQKSISVAPIDLKNKHHRQEVVSYIFKTDREAFGACFQKGFLKEILKSERIRCLVARNKENEIVGILWGFLTDYENHQLFHFWELSRKASMAHMGIAKKLIACAKQQQSLYPNLEFATLNVDVDNAHAKEIYDSENFAALNGGKENVKIFMKNKLNSSSNVNVNLENAKIVVKKFVLNTIPIHKLIYYELMRRCELIWRSFWFR